MSKIETDTGRRAHVNRDLWFRLSALGLLATASLLFLPIEQLAPTSMPTLQWRLLNLIQPAVMVIWMTWLGAWAGPKVGLDAPIIRAWIERRPIWPECKRRGRDVGICGILIAAVIMIFWSAVSGIQGAEALSAFRIPLITKLLYGGIVEELLLRWAIMSFVVWLAWRAAGANAEVPSWCYWLGIGVSAAVFALGHLPILHLIAPNLSMEIAALVIAGNALPGIILGWLYWRHGLEASMLAHGLAHLLSTASLFAIGGR